MYYLSLKAIHIIGVIVWFAGLFYLGRLFVYHQETAELPEPERSALKKQFSLMEKRLYYGITWPGLCISIVFGTALIFELGLQNWLYSKIALVALLVVYHLWCGSLRKSLLNDKCKWSGKQFRLFNEIPTLLLVSLVFVVVFKNVFSWSVFLLLLGALTLLIVGVVQWLAKRRNIKSSKNI
ncbi:MAG: protoporphyrinogen oxidase HemJ [SAR324 cluster bacterium]|nr:protoporphyrinogen oxidase HemJ [SAR324 cluster bacterium]MBL7034856.1 protoporphyrinogen oxidase HemJ [SAR324 cluster bacterium]